MKRCCFIAVIMACLGASVAFSTGKQVLLLGDEVLFSYKPDLLELIGDKAVCTFVGMPETGRPDWDAFCEQHVYGKEYDVIHVSYGRELMVHEGGRPRAALGNIRISRQCSGSEVREGVGRYADTKGNRPS